MIYIKKKFLEIYFDVFVLSDSTNATKIYCFDDTEHDQQEFFNWIVKCSIKNDLKTLYYIEHYNKLLKIGLLDKQSQHQKLGNNGGILSVCRSNRELYMCRGIKYDLCIIDYLHRFDEKYQYLGNLMNDIFSFFPKLLIFGCNGSDIPYLKVPEKVHYFT